MARNGSKILRVSEKNIQFAKYKVQVEKQIQNSPLKVNQCGFRHFQYIYCSLWLTADISAKSVYILLP